MTESHSPIVCGSNPDLRLGALWAALRLNDQRVVNEVASPATDWQAIVRDADRFHAFLAGEKYELGPVTP